MSSRQLSILVSTIALTLGCLGLRPPPAPAAPQDAQEANDQIPAAPGVVTAETNLVLVDVVARDKKGNYIGDLEAADFRVSEDGKEQALSTFSRVSESRGESPAQPRYLLLFFDNSTMTAEQQVRARAAAGKFVEKVASPERLMAVVDFIGASRISQDFTDNGEALKRAVGGVRFAGLQPNERGQPTEVATMGPPSAFQMRTDYAARSVLLAIRNLAKNLRAVPGRKTLILFSGGFPLTAERQSELTATIDAANKANVAIYPVDVRGLEGGEPGVTPGFGEPTRQAPRFPGLPPGAQVVPEEPGFPHERALLASLAAVLGPPQPLAQRPQGGGGSGGASGGGTGGTPLPPTGGGRPGGTTGGTTTGGMTGGTSPRPGTSTGASRGTTPFAGGSRGGAQPGSLPTPGNTPFGPDRRGLDSIPRRPIIPPITDSATANQQVLFALATGTGGFTIYNTNDFLKGLEKIAKELNEYYILGYLSPNRAHDGSYHEINVKVTRKGVKLRHRNGYYDVKSPDLLAGKPEGQILEERAASSQPTDFPVALSAPYFYTASNVARVNLVLDVPGKDLNFEKQKGKFHSEVNVLGIAYRADNSVAARFSDTVKLDFEKKEMKEFTKGAFNYQNSFNIAPGKYTLKVVMSAGGQKFGKYEMLLEIELYDESQFHISDVALSNQMRPVSQLTLSFDTALLEERIPLVVSNVEMIPSPSNRFSRDEKVGLYVEVYEPLMLRATPPRVGIIYDLIDRKTNQRVFTSNTILVNHFAEQGNPVIPVGVFVPVDQLAAGEYRLEVLARDAEGNVSSQQTEDFVVE